MLYFITSLIHTVLIEPSSMNLNPFYFSKLMFNEFKRLLNTSNIFKGYLIILPIRQYYINILKYSNIKR